MKKMELSANMEDYLEAIAAVAKAAGVARVTEIGRTMDVKNSSVHAALHHLAEKGLVQHEHYGYVRLTESGADLAGAITARHALLEKFFRDFLGVSTAIASDDACRTEHTLSPTTLTRLARFIEFLASRPEWPAWSEAFHGRLGKDEAVPAGTAG